MQLPSRNLLARVPSELWILIAGSVGLLSAYGLGLDLAAVLCSSGLAGLATRIALQDLKSFTIADSDQALVAGLGLLCLWTRAPDPWLLGAALLRTAMFAGSFELLRRAYFASRARQGLGFGDVKLAGAAGFWLEPTDFAFCVGLAAACGLAFALLRMRLKRRKLRRTAALPLGTFLAPAIWMTWIVGGP